MQKLPRDQVQSGLFIRGEAVRKLANQDRRPAESARRHVGLWSPRNAPESSGEPRKGSASSGKPRKGSGSCPVLSCPVLSCPVLSCPVLSCPVLSCPVLSCPVLSCPVLSCPVLSCPVLSCPVLSCRCVQPVCSHTRGRGSHVNVCPRPYFEHLSMGQACNPPK